MGQSVIRGLGCGGQSKPAGKISKLCIDCGEKSLVEGDVILCPICDGPLLSNQGNTTHNSRQAN